MRTQTIGAVMLIMAVCLISVTLAENETSNNTETNMTNSTGSNLTNETGNNTNQTGINQTANQTTNGTVSNQTNTTGNTTTNDTSLSNQTCNQTGNASVGNQTCNQTGNATANNTTVSNQTSNQTNNTNTNLTNNTGSGTTDEDLDLDDERHVCLMNEPYGIEIRYLQLERAVMRNTLIGAAAIKIINESNSSADLTEAKAILEEMKDLLDEIRDADLDGNKTKLAQDFVDFKKDANLLSESFREAIQPYLNRTIKQLINNATKEIDRTAFADIDDEIRLAKCSLNAERVKQMLSDLNATDAAFVEKVGKCNATEKEIRDRIYAAFMNLTPEQKREYLKKVREGSIRSIIAGRALMEEIRDGYFERRMQRQEKMMESFQKRMDRLALKMEKFMDKFEKQMDKTRMKMEKMMEKQRGKMSKFEGKWSEKHGNGDEE